MTSPVLLYFGTTQQGPAPPGDSPVFTYKRVVGAGDQEDMIPEEDEAGEGGWVGG